MDYKKLFVIAKCPNCHKPVMYSGNPLDKSTVKTVLPSETYRGKAQLCAKCKKMYVLLETPCGYSTRQTQTNP